LSFVETSWLKVGLYSFLFFLQRIQQGYLMGFYVFEHFKPLCFHYINQFNELQMPFWAMNKISIQQLCNKPLCFNYPHKRQGLECQISFRNHAMNLNEKGCIVCFDFLSDIGFDAL
jgi:hypothetical protein